MGLGPCACDAVGGGCFDGLSFSCERGEWYAGTDGFCWATDLLADPCQGRFDSALSCVESFDICFDARAGHVCGYGARTALCDDGIIIDDPRACLQGDAFCREIGDGSYCTGGDAPDCPVGYTPIDDCPNSPVDCVQYTESLSCQVPSYTAAECGAIPGTVADDPGDGSLFSRGCPDGARVLGTVELCIEGCLCCAPVER
jgi:hypothetical protein